MKKYILLMIMLLIVSSAFASTPDFSITTDLQSNIKNGDGQLIGKFIIVKKPYLSQVSNVENFTAHTIQNFDGIRWTGNGSIIIKNSNATVVGIVSPGESFFFATSGFYIFTANGNESLIGNIAVLQEAIPTVTIKIEAPQMAFVYPSSILLTGNEHTFNVTANVSTDLLPSNINMSYSFVTANKSINNTHTLVIPELKLWNVTNSTIERNITLKAGETRPLGEIVVTNFGNVNFPVTAEVVGNGSFLIQTQKQQTLFRKTSTSFGITAQVPQKYPDGNYNATILLRAGDYSYYYDIPIVVKDLTPPEISKIRFRDNFVYHANAVAVDVTDNIGVKEVNVTIFVTNQTAQTFNMSSDQQVYTYLTNFTSLSQYSVTVCAWDFAGNQACSSTTKEFRKLQPIAWSPTNQMPSRKFGKMASGIVFNLTEELPRPNDEPLRIELISFISDIVASNESNATTENSFQVSLVDGDGSVKQLERIGATVDIKRAGNIKIEVHGDKISSYEGVLRVYAPNYIENTSDIRFQGKFLDYDVPEPFEREWYGKMFKCDVKDTGDLESSFFECDVQFPISTDVENLAVPTTPGEKDLEDQKLNSTIVEATKKITNRNMAISALVGVVLIVILLSIYIVVIHPYLRIKTGGKS